MTAAALPAVILRPAVESDAALIYSSWLRSYWNSTMSKSGVAYQDYARGQRARIDRLLAKHGAVVACSPEAPSTIMSWACVGRWTIPQGFPVSLHYVYTRQPYRRQGHARLLVAADADGATHMTPAFARCFPTVPFNPYLLEQT